MKKSILAISVVFSLVAALRGQNRIDYLLVNEASGRLLVYGQFENVAGQVLIQNGPLAVLGWSDSLISCEIPDSGTLSAGEVRIVGGSGDTITGRLLSEYWFTVSYGAGHGGGPIHGGGSNNWKIVFRADVAPSPLKGYFSSPISKLSTCSFGISEDFDPTPPDNPQGVISGGATLPWIDPDSGYDSGFSGRVWLAPNNLPYIEFGDVQGEVYNHHGLVDTIVTPEAYTLHGNGLSNPFIQWQGNHIAKSKSTNFSGYFYCSYYPSGFTFTLSVQPDSDKFVPENSSVKLDAARPTSPMVYPNPCHGFLDPLPAGISRLVIYSMIGSKLFEIENPEGKINISSLPNGSYFVELHALGQVTYASLRLFK